MSNRKLAPNTTLLIQDDCFPSCHSSPGNATRGDWQKKTLSARLNLCKTTAVCTARSFRNTIKMILLPSHTTCSAGFCINVLRIKNIMLQSYNKHIHTACHSQTCYNFYYSVIWIITVAGKTTTSSYFFPLLRASSYLAFIQQKPMLIHMTRLFHTW